LFLQLPFPVQEAITSAFGSLGFAPTNEALAEFQGK